MKLENLEKELAKFNEMHFRAIKAQKRLTIIKHELELLYADLAKHKALMTKEHEDVVKLEKITTRILFSSILGNSKQQLEKERQEYLQATLEYNSIAHEINLLLFEQDLLKSKMPDIKEINRSLNYYLKIKEKKIIFQKSAHAEKLKIINTEIDRLYTFNRELKEAIAVATKLDIAIIQAHQKLKKVRKFQYSSMYGKGKYSSYAKKSYIDKAINDISQINYLMNKLEKELSDIYNQFTFFSIYKYQNFVDSFYDNLITDYVLQNKLKNALGCLDGADNQIKRILATIDHDLAKSNQKITALHEEKRMYILNSK